LVRRLACQRPTRASAHPQYGWWLLSALGVGAAAQAIRQVVPTGVNVIGLELGYFASYIFLYFLGIAAWRHDWLRRTLNWHARYWIIALLLSALSVGAAALAVLQVTGVNVIGLELGYFAGYIFLYFLGIAAWRYDWLRELNWEHARGWIIALVIAWLSFPAVRALAVALNGPGTSNYTGGLNWMAIAYAFWEPFIAWGMIAAWLLVFRRYMNQPSSIWTWLNRRSYLVFIIHPVVLVGVSLLLRGWAAPVLVKLAVIGTLACATSFMLADPLVRMPGLRRIV